MKRFVWGIILMVIGVVSLGGPNGADEDAILGGFMCLIAGAVLTYYGNKYKKGIIYLNPINNPYNLT